MGERHDLPTGMGSDGAVYLWAGGCHRLRFHVATTAAAVCMHTHLVNREAIRQRIDPDDVPSPVYHSVEPVPRNPKPNCDHHCRDEELPPGSRRGPTTRCAN